MWWSELPPRLACAGILGLMAACAGADASPASTAAGVCAPHAGKPPTGIDVFDGPPTDQAILAPDGEGAAANTYTVKDVYAQGRIVTIRCHYGAETVDVPLTRPVAACHASGEGRPAQIACR